MILNKTLYDYHDLKLEKNLITPFMESHKKAYRLIEYDGFDRDIIAISIY